MILLYPDDKVMTSKILSQWEDSQVKYNEVLWGQQSLDMVKGWIHKEQGLPVEKDQDSKASHHASGNLLFQS